MSLLKYYEIDLIKITRMKTILVPIDFSETSDNALHYAASLGQHVSANLLLLHVNTLPVYTNEYDVASYTINDSVIDSLSVLKEKAKAIKSEFKYDGEINCIAEAGDLKTAIQDMIFKHAIDFVVMGITGHNTKIGQMVFGSNAVSVSREANIPVFIIPTACKFKAIKNIAYASQYVSDIREHTGLIQIKNISALFNSKLFVLHVIPENHLINQMESETDQFVEEKLENVNHRTFILTDNKVSVALLDFIKTHDIDLVVIEQKKHSFLHKLLYPSATKEVAFASPIPVLTIHS